MAHTTRAAHRQIGQERPGRSARGGILDRWLPARYIWVINPRTREAFIHTAMGMHEAEDGILCASDPDIAIPLAEVLG
jgi:hypothetical protein